MPTQNLSGGDDVFPALARKDQGMEYLVTCLKLFVKQISRLIHSIVRSPISIRMARIVWGTAIVLATIGGIWELIARVSAGY